MNRVAILYLSFLLALVILVATGLIPNWGAWYSTHLTCRLELNAIMRGHIYVASTPSELGWDLAWVNGHVQQAFGLAVPFWRLPFEIIVRLFGLGVFPDRIEFGIFLMLVTNTLLRFVCTPIFGEKTNVSFVLIGLFSTVLFPPFVSLCCAEFTYYDEVVAYGYLACISLFVWAARLCHHPGKLSYYLLVFLSGFTPFIRPTIGAYGLATLVISSYALWKAKAGIKTICLGAVFFSFGIMLLLWSNNSRFGSPLEFGHSLILNNVDAMRFASRFDHPFHSESCYSAGKELFGLLFLTKSVKNIDGTQPTEFWGQSPAYRFRELYFNTYDMTFCVMILCVVVWSACRMRVGNPFRNKALDFHDQSLIWACLAGIPLVIFYVHFPFISSRYLIDFAPAFACVVWAFFWSLHRFLGRLFTIERHSLWAKRALIAVMLTWWGTEVFAIEYEHHKLVGNVTEINNEIRIYNETVTHPIYLPDHCYTNGFDFESTGIPYNGLHWQKDTSGICVPLYVKDPEFLTLEIAPVANCRLITNNYRIVQAKIGLEYLQRQSITISTNMITIRFWGPRKEQYKKGIQTVFIGMIDPDKLGHSESSFNLFSVTWRRKEDMVK